MTTIPNREPDNIIVLQLTKLDGSKKATIHNKFWIAQVWQKEGVGQRNWGSTRQSVESILADLQAGKKVGQQKVESKPLSFYEREAEYRTNPNGTSSKYAVVKYGTPYTRVKLADKVKSPSAPALPSSVSSQKPLTPAVYDLVGLLTSTANSHIQQHFSGDVAAVSDLHIAKTRRFLFDAADEIPHLGITPQMNDSEKFDTALRAVKAMPKSDRKTVVDVANGYYSRIPSPISKGTLDEMLAQFLFHLTQGDIEERLEQIETAAKIALAQQSQPIRNSLDPVEVAYQQIGCLIKHIDNNSDEAKEIERRFNLLPNSRVRPVPAKIKGVFAIHLPGERDAFLNDDFGAVDNSGKNAVLPLWHGTRLQNVQHILRTGLVIKRAADNGSRFGRGLYHSSSAPRSWNYTGGGGRGRNEIMFISHVKVGEPYCDNGSNTRADLNWVTSKNCHSVLAEGEWGRQGDEFITYKTEQSTLSYAVLLG